MRFVGLISGGKDSIYSICKLLDEENILVGLIYMESTDIYADSYMYQTVGVEIIDHISEALNVPLFKFKTGCKPINIELTYDPIANDEVEDLHDAIKSVSKKISFEAISSGAIQSRYQKNRIENICKRLGIKSLTPLWNRDQKELLKEMIEYGIEARIIKIAGNGLIKKCLNMNLKEIYDYLETAKYPYGFNYCGEGGEYETVVLDCKYFKKRIIFEKLEIKSHPEENMKENGAVFYLKLSELKSVPKD